jgi:hypothetical protein
LVGRRSIDFTNNDKHLGDYAQVLGPRQESWRVFSVDDQQAQAVMQELVASGQITDPDCARGKLLQTAAHLFRSKGYERTTVRDLASAVGIQSGSIFHHFKSKDEILRSVMEETIRYNTALMQASLAEASDLRGRVLALIRCELQSIMGGTGECTNGARCQSRARRLSLSCVTTTNSFGLKCWARPGRPVISRRILLSCAVCSPVR